MSGFAEVVGGVAAVSQILDNIIKSTKTVATFCQDMKEAPSQYRRIQERPHALGCILKAYEAHLSSINDETLLPMEIRDLLRCSLNQVDEEIRDMRHSFLKVRKSGVRVRLRYALVDKDKIQQKLDRLQLINGELAQIMELYILKLSTLVFTSLTSLEDRIASDKPTVTNSRGIAVQTTHRVTEHRCHHRCRPFRPKLCSVPESWLQLADSWLGRLGFYGCATTFRGADRTKTTNVVIGYKFPAFVYACSWTLCLRISTSGAHLLDGHIRIQNRVHRDTPFMDACAQGDVQLMKQLLADGQGRVHDRTSCSGKTPLLLAIELGNIEAVRYLLQAGSDPDIGDDEGILPVFACLGLTKIRRNADGTLNHHSQRTPSGEGWLSILELLIQHGASVHEIVADKTMTTLNISNKRHGEDTLLRYFKLLTNEYYQDFGVVGRGGYSALINAVRVRNASAAALDLLGRAGVQLDRISTDGRGALHIASMEGSNSKPLEHLYENCGITDINRRDKWGWTPLHAAINSDSNRRWHDDCGKVRFLLSRGADPNMKGPTEQIRFRRFEKYLTPAELAAKLGRNVYMNFLSDLEAVTGGKNDKDDEETFFDAEENLNIA